jgi:hypothetical protein
MRNLTGIPMKNRDNLSGEARIVSYAFKHGIVKHENGKLIRGWEIVDERTYRIKA